MKSVGRPPRVLTVCDHGGVSEFYRTVTPYRLLAEAGLIELTTTSGQSPALIDNLHKFDAVVFSRADTPIHSLVLREALLAGLRVIFDIDDNLILLPPSIPAYSAWHHRGSTKIAPRLWYLKRNIRLASALTVSTEALGRQLCNGEPHALRGRNDFIHLPNQILASEWEGLEPDSSAEAPADGAQAKPAGEVWVGWWGIYNHWDDWRDVAPFIEPVIARRPNVRLVVLGMPEIAHLFPVLRKTDQLIIGDFVAPDELEPYRRIVKSFDVALAPTSPGPFNESKSDLKMLQYGAAGVPVIASKTTYDGWEPYATILNSPTGWGRALEAALDNPLVARAQAEELHKFVMTHRTYEANFTRWLGALGVAQMPGQRLPATTTGNGATAGKAGIWSIAGSGAVDQLATNGEAITSPEMASLQEATA